MATPTLTTVASASTTAEQRVEWLLRTYYDVRDGGYNADPTGQGVRMMPGDW